MNLIHPRERLTIASFVVAVGLVAVVGAAPASATTGMSTSAVEATLARFEVAQATGSQPDAQLSSGTGLVIPAGTSRAEMPEVSMKPTNSATAPRLSQTGVVVYSDSLSSAVALSSDDAAGYVVIADATAPGAYSFEIKVGDRPATLKVLGDGAVSVAGPRGDVVNSIAAPWAVDADGRAVDTFFTVDGAKLTQHVDHRGAAYPVVADPRFVCSGLFCTIELTRAETKRLANNVLNLGGACVLMGPAAPVCVVVLTGMWAQAKIAVSRGECVGVRGLRAPVVTGIHGVYVRCYS